MAQQVPESPVSTWDRPAGRPSLRRLRTRWTSVVAALLVGLGTVGGAPNASAAAALDGIVNPDPFMQQRISLFDLQAGDLCLDAEPGNGSPVTAEQCTTRRSKQAWRVTRVTDPSGGDDVTVTIKNIDHGRCMQASPASMDDYLAGRSDTFQIDVGLCVAGDRRQMWDLRGPTFGSNFQVEGVPAQAHGFYIIHANLAENLEGFVETVIPIRSRDVPERTGLIGTRSDITTPWGFQSVGFMCAVANLGTVPVFLRTEIAADREHYRCA